MFEDMGCSIGTVWKSFEREAEEVFWIIVFDVHHHRSGREMDEFTQGGLKFINGLHIDNGKVSVFLSFFHKESRVPEGLFFSKGKSILLEIF